MFDSFLFIPRIDAKIETSADAINLNQSCHDRAHTDAVPATKVKHLMKRISVS